MKKYNLSDIMKNAWYIRRMAGCTMSDALRKSWANAKAPKDVVSKLLEAGGHRWTKNGMDRIYLSKAISSIVYDSCSDVDFSRKTRNAISNMINSAYYDVVNSKLVYSKCYYTWMSEEIERAFNAIAA